jgi:hypothetical protein
MRTWRMSFRTQLRQVADEALPIDVRVDRLWSASETFASLGPGRMFSRLARDVGAADGTWTSEQLSEAARLLADAKDSFSDYWRKQRSAARLAKGRRGYEPKQLRDVYGTWWSEYFGRDSAPPLEIPTTLRRATNRVPVKEEDAPSTLRRRARAFVDGLRSRRAS